MEQINYSDFEKIEIRTGTILHAEIFEKAKRPAYKLTIDFGELGIKKSSAQIADYYSIDTLPGKQIIAIVNFPVKQIANFFSECLVLGAIESDGKVVLLQTSMQVKNGLRIA
ncbi:MAG: tRNA-binding protein [Bacteroidetes bacterium]|nr:tRNA-binding protein [Bacteroidota bacterium]